MCSSCIPAAREKKISQLVYDESIKKSNNKNFGTNGMIFEFSKIQKRTAGTIIFQSSFIMK